MNSMKNFGVTIWTLLFCLAGAFHLSAQGPTATVLGTVTDASGAAIPEAALQVKNSETGTVTNATSDTEGRYRVPDLPIGNYSVSTTKQGFQTSVRTGITLSVGQTAVVDFLLPVGQAQQTVTVESQVSQVETTTAAVSSLVDQTQMRELPLNGRNVQQLVLLAPGVQQYNGFAFGAFRGGSAGGYSVSGSRPVGQVQLLDNQNIQNWWTTGSGAITLGTSLGVEAIAEFQMLTGVYSAQFGGNGAVMNAVTKSGTNAFHGSAFDFLRNSALDARNEFDKANVPAFRKNQFGGSIGGPIKKDKLFFYGDFEGIRQLLSETKVAILPDANAHKGLLPCSVATAFVCNAATGLANVGVNAAIAPALASLPIPTNSVGGGAGNITEVAPQIASENYFLGRVDYILSEKDAVYGRIISDKANLQEPFTIAPIPLWPEKDYSWNIFGTLEERHIFSPNLVNLLRASYSRPAQHGRSGAKVPGFNAYPGLTSLQDTDIVVTGLNTAQSNWGPLTQTPYDLIVNRFNESDDVTWIKGAHTLRFGASFTRRDNNTFNLFREGGVWTFGSLLNFLTNNPSTVAGLLPGEQYGNRDLREIQFEPYVQEDWKLRRNLTLNLGIRYVFISNPIDVHDNLNEIVNPQAGNAYTHVSNLFQNGNPSKDNWDPRFGLAWDPFKDHKTSFRAGFGMFHDPVVYNYFPAVWSQPPAASSQIVNPTTFPTPFVANVTPVLQTSPGYDFRINKSPYQIQWNFNIQRQIAANTTLSVSYQGSRGVHLFISPDQNPVIPKCCSSDGRLVFSSINAAGKLVPFARVDPAYSALLDGNTIGNSNYNGLQVGLNRRFTPNFTYQLSYTYSHSLDNGSSTTTGESSNNNAGQNPYNYRSDYSSSAFDLRHALRINGVYALPFKGNQLISGWQLAGITAWQTGVPITVTNGWDQMGDTTVTRPDYNPGCTNSVLGTIAHWYNPVCFSAPPAGTPGNSARTSIEGPHLVNTDLSLIKDTRIPKISDVFMVQFRAEVFNLFNHPNLGYPTAGLFTQGAVIKDGSGNPVGFQSNVAASAGQITSTLTPSRQIQFGLKILF
jgi:outer membrane receptor protein involved in Fe transport